LRSELTIGGRGSGDLGGIGSAGPRSSRGLLLLLLLLVLNLLPLAQERNIESGDPPVLLGLGALHIGLVLGSLVVRGHRSLGGDGVGLGLCLLFRGRLRLLLRNSGLPKSSRLGYDDIRA